MASAGFGVPNNSGGWAFKVDPDGNTYIGDEASDIVRITGSVFVDGPAVFNEGSIDADFRVESNHATHMFYIDGGNNRIGVGNNSPQNLLDIIDPFNDIAGHEKDAVLRLVSKKSVGIKLVADTDNSDESDNPFIDFYADGNSDTSGRNNRKGSLALEDVAGTTFTGSLADAFFMDAFYPLIGHSNRPLQIANASVNNGHKARITLEGTNGYVGIHTATPTHSLEVSGDFKATEEVIFGTTSTDLGNGQTSTLTPASSVHLLDATSITANAAVGAHVMTLADGTTAGQILKVIMNTTTNNQPIMISPANILGSYGVIAIENNKQGAAFDFIWTGSKWVLIGNNTLASVG
tara:strand:+ start:6884 stop:7930 length:1047 start_codon:yes stop_codon:yes gene_type:complete